MGSLKAPSKQGNITQTTTNKSAEAQLPFLQGGWGAAQDLYRNNPSEYYPGPTMAEPNFWLPTGYNNLANAGSAAHDTQLPAGWNMFNSFGGPNNIYGSPAFSGLSDIASGSNAWLQQAGANVGALSGVGNQAGANPYVDMLRQAGDQASWSNDAWGQLTNTMSGAYLNSNPYVDRMFDAASGGVTRQYQSATAPNTSANFAGAGRYGSGAMSNAVSQNQQDLGSTLNNLSSNIYGANYQAERDRQEAAAGTFGQLVNAQKALSGGLLGQAGALQNQGLGLAADAYSRGGALDLQALAAQQNALNTTQSGYQAGETNRLGALGMFPSLMQAQYAPAQAQIQAGQGMTDMSQQVVDDMVKRFYGQQSAPWQSLERYMSMIKPAIGESSASQTTPVMGPSPLSSATSMIGTIAQAAPMIMSLFGSDRRMKKDIERIGVLPNGLPVYSFRYVWSAEPHVGLMADEVEAVFPDAVFDHPTGFKMVDYRRALEIA
jgi:hypothetical protein